MTLSRFNRQSAGPGQSLVELVLVTTFVLLPVLLIAGYAGMAIYQGTMASEAIKEPTVHKMDMANMPNAVGAGQLTAYALGGVTGSLMPGAILDSVTTADINPYITIMEGSKTSIPVPLLNVQFTFTVTEAIQRRLLDANNGTISCAMNTPCLFGGGGRVPWTDPLITQLKAPVLSCGSATMTTSDADQLVPNAPPSQYYHALNTTYGTVPYTKSTVMSVFVNSSYATSKCPPAKFQGQCQGYYNDFIPKPWPGTPVTCAPGSDPTCATYSSLLLNPPGRPGMEVMAKVQGGARIPLTITPAGFTSDPAHGWYWDPTGMYVGPTPNMVNDCVKRWVAECKVEWGTDLAKQVAAAYPEECGKPF